MASTLPTRALPDASGSSSGATNPSGSSKPQRVLACVLCQQRKVKCDRRFPCSYCIKSHVQCVPATLVPRQRRRRFPERVLLERLRKYEDLLRQHNIPFEPLHNDQAPASKDFHNADEGNDQSDNDQPVSSPSSTVRSERLFEAKNLIQTMNKWYRDPADESNDSEEKTPRDTVKSAWDQLCGGNSDRLLLGTPRGIVDLSTLHPEPVQILRLWQTYLDNVNPLLKVTHTPTLQPRIIEAASDVRNINATLEALMFSIYAMAVTSLSPEDCEIMFVASRNDLLTRYQFGCQEALCNATYLRTNDLECLTALFLYLVSVGRTTHPQSLNSLFGVVTRIARRLRIDNEAANARSTALEAEMRRRVWWSFILLDSRFSKLSDYPSTTLSPLFDCKTPLNVNDSELRAEARDPPAAQAKPTEAIFSVVRSQLADFIRHTTFYLDFSAPALKTLSKMPEQDPSKESAELVNFEKMLEDKYLRHCDADVPLHYFTIWSARYFIAKHRLMQQFWKMAISKRVGTDAERDDSLNTALTVLDCDTKVLSNRMIQGFQWLFQFYFPFPAYVHVVQELQRRPLTEFAGQAWEAMSNNFAFRSANMAEFNPGNPIHKIFSRIILDAWCIRQRACKQAGDVAAQSAPMPGIVALVMSWQPVDVSDATSDNPGGLPPDQSPMDMNLDDFSMPLPLGMDSPNLLFGIGETPPLGDGDASAFAAMEPNTFSNPMMPVGMDMGMEHLNWANMAWGVGRRGGGS